MAKFNGFSGDYIGLSEEQVHTRREKSGYNELTPKKEHTVLDMISHVFTEPMFLLLIVTAGLYFVLGEPRDGIIMLCFVAFISGINIFQEWRTDKTLQALKDLSSPKVTVIRGGFCVTVESRELVPGDLMFLEEGDKISADVRLLELADLGIDESTLTGESEVVWKKRILSEDENTQHWKKNMCYAGTSVTQGSAIAEITSTGISTEYGKIGQDILSVPQLPTPLEKQTRHLIKVCAFIGLGLFILVGIFTFLNPRGVTSFLDQIVHSVLAGMTLAMAMIPEEFPVILTVFLAMGAWRLAKKKSLIRRMPSVETLGSVTVLCVDKTGTLTKNQMTIQEAVPHERDPDTLVRCCALACEPEPYDPMEKAMLSFAEKKGIALSKLFDRTLLFEYPFSSETKMMGHIWEIDGEKYLAAKGSPESILPLCGLSSGQETTIAAEQHRLASQGYRVIAVAQRVLSSEIPSQLSGNHLTFLGLIGLEDPPRDGIVEAVKLCRKSGIRVVMITGDNGVTALSIAKKIGLTDSADFITGTQLDALSDEELKEKVKAVSVFARVIPSHKKRIVTALKDNGEVAAMTGDGVNDAPALKYADIGIAMGMRGTNVAKEAADMVLLDDNFSTIVDTVKDGRRIYDNIKKAVGYVFVIHIPIALIALLSPLFHFPLLLLPIHIVLLELIIDPTCSIILERQPAEPDIMDRKPRSPSEALINLPMMLKSCLQGLVIFAATFGSYAYLLQFGLLDEYTARAFSLCVLIFSNLFLIYINQSEKISAFQSIARGRDNVVWSINLCILGALIFIIFTPFGNSIARTAPLRPDLMLYAFGLAALATLWWDIVKLMHRVKKH